VAKSALTKADTDSSVGVIILTGSGDKAFVAGADIKEFANGGYFNHLPRAKRKLLLTKRELNKLHRKVKETGLTIIPLKLFINEKGWAKLEIALCRGKKKYDKRQSLKAKEDKRNLDRMRKNFINR
jgi:SsrA-binding protein